MANTTLAIAEFPTILDTHSTRSEDARLGDILRDVERVKTQNPTVYSDRAINRYLRERAKIIMGLAEDYFTSAISQKFPLLSDELFELKRHITIERTDKGYKVVRDDTEPDSRTFEKPTRKNNAPEMHRVEVPLFAYVELLKGDHKAVLGRFSKKVSRRSSYGDLRTVRTKAEIEAKLPGAIGPNLRSAYREALSHYFEVLGEILKEPAMGELILERELENPEVGAIWIPTPESLNVAVKKEVIQRRNPVVDPAMILTARNRRYLVKTWMVDDEEPLEHYLREFSSGNLEGKVSPQRRRRKRR